MVFRRSGTFKPEQRAQLEAEGLVLLEERLRGKRRFVIVTGMLRRELANSEFDRPSLTALEISLEDDETVALKIDYDEMEQPDVSGEVTISFATPSAGLVVDQLRSRIG